MRKKIFLSRDSIYDEVDICQLHFSFEECLTRIKKWVQKCQYLCAIHIYFFEKNLGCFFSGHTLHCHIVLTMIFGVQFPISPSVVLSFFEKFREITHTLKKSIVTTSERQWIHCHSFFSVKMLHILQIKFHCHH